jgi:hypothetical protein
MVKMVQILLKRLLYSIQMINLLLIIMDVFILLMDVLKNLHSDAQLMELKMFVLKQELIVIVQMDFINAHI